MAAQQGVQEQGIDPGAIECWRTILEATRQRYPDLTEAQVRAVAEPCLIAHLRRVLDDMRVDQGTTVPTPKQRAARVKVLEASMDAAYASVLAGGRS